MGDDYSKCLALKTALQLTDADMALGKSKVFLSYAAWRRVDDPVRAIERMDLGEKGGRAPHHDGELAAYADPTNASATSYGDQSEAHLMLNAQPPGKNSFSDASLGGNGAQHVRALKGRMFGGGADVRSYYSDDDGYQDMGGRDGGSEMMSERGYNGGYADTLPSPASRSASAKKAAGHAAHTDADEIPDAPASTKRKVWLAFVWMSTWLVPSFALKFCARIKRRDERIAWREKVALCMIIFWSCAFVIFWIVGLGLILCPRQHVYSSAELQSHNTAKDALISVRGEVFDIKDFSHMNMEFKYLVDHNYLGLDQSNTFPYQLSFVCPFPDMDPRLSFQPKPQLYSAAYYHDHRWWRHPTTSGYNYYQFRLMRLMRENHSKGHIAVDPKELKKEGDGSSKNALGQNVRRCIIHDQIYDLSAYIDHKGAPYLVSDTQNSTNSVAARTFLDDAVYDMFDQNPGKDISNMWDNYFASDPESHARHIQCLR
ncbi:hypothetical protein GGF43_006188, partial [Coemansia sp. RSA 2618]